MPLLNINPGKSPRMKEFPSNARLKSVATSILTDFLPRYTLEVLKSPEQSQAHIQSTIHPGS
jgi:hypothetical protein